MFNREFFPQIGPAMGTLAAFATFGVGFLFRPLGGIIFGHFGDRLGRKRMLMMTVWMMGIATACIGLLPSFNQIGWWGKKPFTAAGCRWATASASCSLPGWYR